MFNKLSVPILVTSILLNIMMIKIIIIIGLIDSTTWNQLYAMFKIPDISFSTFLLFAVSTIGLTNIMVHGAIFDEHHLGVKSWLQKNLGKFSDLLDCYECTGWWSGLITGMALLSFHPFVFIPCAFAGAALGHAYQLVIDLINHVIGYEIYSEENSDES